MSKRFIMSVNWSAISSNNSRRPVGCWVNLTVTIRPVRCSRKMCLADSNRPAASLGQVEQPEWRQYRNRCAGSLGENPGKQGRRHGACAARRLCHCRWRHFGDESGTARGRAQPDDAETLCRQPAAGGATVALFAPTKVTKSTWCFSSTAFRWLQWS